MILKISFKEKFEMEILNGEKQQLTDTSVIVTHDVSSSMMQTFYIST